MSDGNAVLAFERSLVGLLDALRTSVVAVISESGSGSGTVIGDDRTVVTNHHVVLGESATVIDAAGVEREAVVAGREPKHDLAVLRVPGGGLAPATLAPAATLRPGAAVFAIGNPWGLRGSVTAGVIVATPRAGEVIRADIRLSPGNSGGPLADGLGRVIGINAMIGGGLGMAVPSEAVEALLRSIEREGEAPEPGYLGVAGQILIPAMAAGLPPHVSEGAWLLTAVEPGSPADVAGLWPGDILLDLDGSPPGNSPGRLLRSGRRARARLLRGHELREVDVTPRGQPS